MTHLPQGWILTVWQYGGSTATEQNIDQTIELALRYKAAGIAEKVLDGLTWMGYVASGSATSVADVMSHKQRCNDTGLVYLPWTNPLWGNRNFLAQQAALYASVGAPCGYLVWDSEPYDGFWGANRPDGDAAFLMDEFRRLAPDCINVWQPDPRPGRLAELRPMEWAQYMNVYAPQSYWADFGTGAEAEIIRAHGQAAMFHIGECAPTMGATGTADEFTQAITVMGNLGISSTVCWRLGTLSEAHLNVLRDLAGHNPTDPEPDPCAHLRQQLEAWAAARPYRAPSKKKLTALLDG